MHRVNQLSLGMTKAETLAILGEPDTTTSPGHGIEILHYKLRRVRTPPLLPVHERYYVQIGDGHVTAFGDQRDLNRRLKADVNLKTIAP